ncbi:hypothetical protein H2248_008954 [Termitomyces sp. 'cryptogamus']|nr:hypothetical protein H2248_008954 [Termitomyces sp. 'cryptogamus']
MDWRGTAILCTSLLPCNFQADFDSSYGPLLNHVANSQWTPNLVSFDSGAVYRSTSFYVQMLFNQNRGDEYIPSTLPSRTGTIFWSVVRNTTAQSIIIKVSNTIAKETSLTFNLPFTTVTTTGSLVASESKRPRYPLLVFNRLPSNRI